MNKTPSKPRLQRALLTAKISIMAGLFLLIAVFWLVSTKHRRDYSLVLEQPLKEDLDRALQSPRIDDSPTLTLLLDSVGKVHTFHHYGVSRLPVSNLSIAHEARTFHAHLAKEKKIGGRSISPKKRHESEWAVRIKICVHNQARYAQVIRLLDIIQQEQITRYRIAILCDYNGYASQMKDTTKHKGDLYYVDCYDDLPSAIKFTAPPTSEH